MNVRFYCWSRGKRTGDRQMTAPGLMFDNASSSHLLRFHRRARLVAHSCLSAPEHETTPQAGT